MIIPITLEPKIQQSNDDWIIFELEKTAQIQAIQRENRAPTLTELLYNQTEEQMMTVTELLDQGND